MIRTLVILVALTSRAWAGLDCDDRASLREIEAYAKDRTKLATVQRNYDWVCIRSGDPKIKDRVGKACTAILDRDGEKSECVKVAAEFGFATLGKHDIFALVSALEEDPTEVSGFEPYKPHLFQKIGAPRGAALIVDEWKAAQAHADKREKRHGSMQSWSSWRQVAAEALGALGGGDEQTFLEEQAKATKDKYLAKACRDAEAAIAKRLTPPP